MKSSRRTEQTGEMLFLLQAKVTPRDIRRLELRTPMEESGETLFLLLAN